MATIDIERVRAVLRYRIPSIEIIWKEETGSTNADLLELAHYGVHGWTVLGTDRQTSGHGRHKRLWASPAGGLYLSVLLRLERETSPITLLPLVTGLALREAIQAEAGAKGGEINSRLKWPNDILTENGKLAGILCESSESSDSWIVIAGVGVNMMPLDEEVRKLIANPVTSLAEEADLNWTHAGLVTTFLLRLAERVEDWRRSPEKIISAWLEASGVVNRQVSVKTPTGEVKGIVRGLSQSGALQVMNDEGKLVEITSSEWIEEHDE